MSLANFNLANTCVPHATPAHYYAHDMRVALAVLACVFDGIDFGDLVKKIRQFTKLKSPQKFPAI